MGNFGVVVGSPAIGLGIVSGALLFILLIKFFSLMKFHRSISSLAHWSLLVRERERGDKNMNRGISPLIVRVSLVTIETDVVFVWSLWLLHAVGLPW